MSKARDLANAGTALTTVSATELGYLDGVTSAVQTQINSKIGQSTAINPSTVTAKGDLLVGTGSGTVVAQPVGTNGQVLTANSAQADGVEWTTLTALPTQTGNAGKFLTTNGTTASWGSVGLNWTVRKSAHGQQINAFATNGSGTYVAGGDNGEIYSSTDSAITWTARTSQFGTTVITDVHFGNGLFVAVGQSGKISTSTDGITWTARTSNMGTNAIRQVIYANSLWVAVGVGGGTTNTGGVTYSTDGLTWTRKSQSISTGANYYSVIWNGTNWVVATSSNGTNNYIYATAPSGTWTAAVAVNSSIEPRALFWDGTRHIYLGDNGGWFYSGAGSTLASYGGYSGVPAPQTLDTYGAKYYGGSIYAYGIYIQSFVVADITYPSISTPTISPSTYGTTSLTNAAGSIWVGAAGILIGDNRGRIYSSF
jgi:hypothetical protein